MTVGQVLKDLSVGVKLKQDRRNVPGKKTEKNKVIRFANKDFITQVESPGGTVVENLPANAGDTGSSPGLGGSHMPRSD